MAIATIKCDEHNRPKRAKYHLVVLGNLDYHTWLKEDTAAPDLSQLELRLLFSLVISNKRVLKNCDIKQAFMQSTFVDDIIYFSSSDDVERKFKESLGQLVSVDFMGQVSHFLGIEFSWKYHDDGHLTVNRTQQSFAETLIDSLGFSSLSTSTYTTPYRSGLSIDSIPNVEMSSGQRDSL